MRNRLRTAFLIAAAWWFAAAPFAAAGPEQPLCGELTRVGEIRVLRVWGTSRDRGYAHGYLLAGDIKRLFEAYLADARFSGGAKAHNGLSVPMAAAMMSPRPIYQREMEGIVDGMRAKLGADGAVIAGLGRALEYRDILVVNCLSDRFGPQCSSFAVWGPMTTDGATLTARNLDWPRHDWMLGNEVLLVELPSEKPKRAGWASMTWPAFVGCLSGMNEHGVTAAMHDVYSRGPEGIMGFTPRGLALREAMEKASGSEAIEQIAALFRQRHIAVATSVFVSVPYDAKSKASPTAVMEYDSDRSNESGVFVREPVDGLQRIWFPWQACTNHFRYRGLFTREGKKRGIGTSACSRYRALQADLIRAGYATINGRKLSVSDVWRIAESVNVPGDETNPILTYHTIVFEPNKRRMHVAVASEKEPAGTYNPTPVDLEAVLKPRSETPAASVAP